SVGGRLVLWSEVLARCDIAPRQSASSHWSRDASGPFFLEPSPGKIPIAGNRPARAIKPACDLIAGQPFEHTHLDHGPKSGVDGSQSRQRVVHLFQGFRSLSGALRSLL